MGSCLANCTYTDNFKFASSTMETAITKSWCFNISALTVTLSGAKAMQTAGNNRSLYLNLRRIFISWLVAFVGMLTSDFQLNSAAGLWEQKVSPQDKHRGPRLVQDAHYTRSTPTDSGNKQPANTLVVFIQYSQLLRPILP